MNSKVKVTYLRNENYAPVAALAYSRVDTPSGQVAAIGLAIHDPKFTINKKFLRKVAEGRASAALTRPARQNMPFTMLVEGVGSVRSIFAAILDRVDRGDLKVPNRIVKALRDRV